MGQQQLLLIILGVIIVGIAVAVGITMFQDNAESANRDAVTNDLVQIAAKAQQFYRKPVALGGGGNAWTGNGNTVTMALLVSTAFSNNDNGKYVLTTVAAQSLVFTGYGKTAQADAKYPAFTCTVTPAAYTVAPAAAVDAIP